MGTRTHSVRLGFRTGTWVSTSCVPIVAAASGLRRNASKLSKTEVSICYQVLVVCIELFFCPNDSSAWFRPEIRGRMREVRFRQRLPVEAGVAVHRVIQTQCRYAWCRAYVRQVQALHRAPGTRKSGGYLLLKSLIGKQFIPEALSPAGGCWGFRGKDSAGGHLDGHVTPCRAASLLSNRA